VPMSLDFSFVEAMNEAARTLGSPRSVEETVRAITFTAKDTVPHVGHASISLVDRHGAMHTLVPTDQFVADADRLQCELGEGPCLDAVLGTPLVRSDDLAHDARWPTYKPRAVLMGVGGQMALHMFHDNGSLGGLNLYFDRPGLIDGQTVAVAELFAVLAAAAMGHARELDGLNRALQTRTSIGKAIGLLMERYELDEERAFQFLVRTSQTGNVKLRVIADEIVTAANAKVHAQG
jgi:ANTAR domain-containing protein/GAF domain-containing protein